MKQVSICPYYHQAVELIGRRWTGAILLSLYGGNVRFTDIAATVPGLSDRLLSERLKALEHEGMVDSRSDPGNTGPYRVPLVRKRSRSRSGHGRSR